MKKTMWALAAALAFGISAAAQQAAPAPGRGMGPGARGPDLERRIDAALERRDSLGLSGPQVQALEALREEAGKAREALRDEMRGLREEAAGDRAAARERMEALRERVRETREPLRQRFEEVLTQEQRERMARMMRRDRGPGRAGPPGRGGAGMDRGGRGGVPGRGFDRPGARGFGGRAGPAFRGGNPLIDAYRRGLRDGWRMGRHAPEAEEAEGGSR